MLAVGWNKHVTEFSDTDENELGCGKIWDTCHTEDILATAARSPQTLATSSYCGELVFWKLETGQPYRRYDVENPTSRVKVISLLLIVYNSYLHIIIKLFLLRYPTKVNKFVYLQRQNTIKPKQKV